MNCFKKFGVSSIVRLTAYETGNTETVTVIQAEENLEEPAAAPMNFLIGNQR